MSNELLDAIDHIWKVSNKAQEAQLASCAITAAGRLALKEVLTLLHNRLAVRRVLTTIKLNDALPVSAILPTLNLGEEAKLLLLLTLSIHHSDSLLYLPPEMRETQLRQWAEMTQTEIEVVREAVTLGPAGLTPLLTANSGNHAGSSPE